LLFKFLDAAQPLSVQVHPNDEAAARLDPPDLGKTEAWVILGKEPGSTIYAGLKRGFDRRALEREVARGTSELCLHHFEPEVGDCIFLPAGVVHALGEGLLVAEIQQASDTTYRLYDWGRVGPDGKSRQLHIEEAIEAINYDYGPAEPQQPQPTEREHVERLVTCDKFVLDRWTFSDPQPLGGDDRFHLVAVLEGSVHIDGDPAEQPLPRGGTALVPASCGETMLRPAGHVVLLDIYLP
jgi:mannose-6-phosphate isomerase